MPLLTGRLLFGISCLAWLSIAASSVLVAEEKITLCHAGLITLPAFEQHVKALRAAKRYAPEKIDKLIARNREGGAEFFSSQIIIQESVSGSGTFSLRLFHGLSNAKYRNVTAWACESEDYPIVYFVGFRVRQIEGGTIFVSREKDVVNVISLKTLDAALDKRIGVKIFQSERVLCRDIGVGCEDGIFYDRYKS